MTFLYDIAWWISTATALVAASIPAFLKPLKAFYLLLASALWTAAVIRIALMQGALAALAGGGVSLLWGMLLMLLSLLFSGLRQMANRRYHWAASHCGGYFQALSVSSLLSSPEVIAKRHNDNSLNYFKHKVSNALSEGINSKIRLLKATARGFF